MIKNGIYDYGRKTTLRITSSDHFLSSDNDEKKQKGEGAGKKKPPLRRRCGEQSVRVKELDSSRISKKSRGKDGSHIYVSKKS